MEYELTLKAILDNSVENIVFISPEHKLIAFNKSVEELYFRYFGKQLHIGDDYRNLVSTANLELYLTSFEKAIKGETVVLQKETKIKGISIWFEYLINPVYSPTGELLGVTFIAKNIDKQKKAEFAVESLAETVNSIFENTSETIVLLDKNLKLIRGNKTALKSIKDKKNITAYIGQDFRDFLWENEIEGFLKIFNKALEGEATYTEIKSADAHGNTWWFQVKVQPVYKKDGDLLGVSIITTNTTETKKAHSSLKENEDKFKEIAWNQSHIIRAPLSRIMGIINIIHDYPFLDETEKTQWIDQLSIAAEELDSVIKNIVSLAGNKDQENPENMES